LKVVKIIYLADRLFMERYDSPILNDKLVSMPHGPVNSLTYGYISGCEENGRALWDAYISDREGHEIGLANDTITDCDLDELSDAELDALQEIWRTYGHMDRFELRDFTHKNCPEWVDPNGSSCPIHYELVFKFLGKAENSTELASRIEANRYIDALFASE
jgi:uncharacterized phage-associated protein